MMKLCFTISLVKILATLKVKLTYTKSTHVLILSQDECKVLLSVDPASEDMTEQETAACNQPHPSDLVTQPLSPDRQSVVMVPASPQREVSPSRPSSTPKPAAIAPLKAPQPLRRFDDQLSFLDDILEDEDVSIHK